MSRRFRLSNWGTAGVLRNRDWISGWKKSPARWIHRSRRKRRRPVRLPPKGGHMFGFGSKSIVGLDVGSSSIKAVELRKKGGQIEVAHLGLEPLASDIVVDSMIVDSGTVSSAISKLFLDNQIKSKGVATAVSGHSVIVKKISLPSMSYQELAETIEKEAASHIPFDLADVNLDYQILSEEAGSPQMDVLLVAVKKDKILNYTNVLSMSRSEE